MRTIPQRELGNHSGAILRRAEAGEQFQWVPKEELLRVLRALPPDPTLRVDLRELDGTLEELDDLGPQ